MAVKSEIAEWYRGKAIFITGATGFMGKVLVEKLLRSCPDIGPIYILVRDKKKMQSRDRVDEIMRSSVFNEVRATIKNQKDWLLPIPGDISLPDLGISVEDKQLLQETVSVVFHLAATVRFDEPLRIAVAMNFEGTRSLMQLCLGMTSLSAIVHVSTAFANCNRSVIDELVYSPPAEPDKVMHCVAGMDDNLLEFVTPRLVGDHPNTYTFTKALAEHLIAGYSTKLPIVVVRPSIVAASWREPVPGWTDSLNGPSGLMAAAGKGMLKSMYGKNHFVADMIPVDVCINLFIAAAWEIGSRESTKLAPNVRVYNCVSGPFKSLSWKEFVLTLDDCTKKYAMSDVFSSPTCRMTDNRVKYALSNLLQQTLPAILADVCVRFSGGTPRFHRYRCKLKKMTELLEFFTTHEFKFNVDNVEELKHRLNPTDRIIFDFDVTKIIWKEYVTRYFLGIRRHVMNEKDDTIPVARRQIVRRTLMTRAVQIAAFVIVAMNCFQIYPPSSVWLNIR